MFKFVNEDLYKSFKNFRRRIKFNLLWKVRIFVDIIIQFIDGYVILQFDEIGIYIKLRGLSNFIEWIFLLKNLFIRK